MSRSAGLTLPSIILILIQAGKATQVGLEAADGDLVEEMRFLGAEPFEDARVSPRHRRTADEAVTRRELLVQQGRPWQRQGDAGWWGG